MKDDNESQVYVECSQCGAKAYVEPMQEWLLIGTLPYSHPGWGHFEDGVWEYILCSDTCRTMCMDERPGHYPLQPVVIEAPLKFKEPFPETRLVDKACAEDVNTVDNNE